MSLKIHVSLKIVVPAWCLCFCALEVLGSPAWHARQDDEAMKQAELRCMFGLPSTYYSLYTETRNTLSD